MMIIIYLAVIIMLLGMSIVAAIYHTIATCVLLTISLLIFVRCMPFCRGYENAWVFFLVAVFFSPVNITRVLSRFVGLDPLFDLLSCIDICVILLSFEEIIMASITRFLWKEQKELPFSESNSEQD